MRPTRQVVALPVMVVLALACTAIRARVALAQAPQPSTPRFGAWIAPTGGYTLHQLACEDCLSVSRTEGIGTVAGIAGGVRVARVLVGASHREWQSWHKDHPGRGRSNGVVVNVVVDERWNMQLAPFIGVGRETYRRDGDLGDRVIAASSYLTGGLEAVLLPHRHLSPVVAIERMQWLVGDANNDTRVATMSGMTVGVGVMVH